MEQTKKAYAWKLIGLAKGVNIDDAVQELERIESLYGSLTPENVLKASKPKKAVLHSLFEWDNTIAGEQYRLQQARTIINNIEVKVIANGQPKKVAVYEVIRQPAGKTYKSIQTMSSDDIEFIKERTKKELNILKNKLSFYQEMSKAVVHIQAAIDAI